MALDKIGVEIEVKSKGAAKAISDVTKGLSSFNDELNKNREATKILDQITGGAVTQFKDYKASLTGGIKAVKGLSASFKGLRTAVISTGIGALVVALALIVAYWDDITELVSGVSAEQKDLLATQEQSVQASRDQSDAISMTENTLRLQGKSEEDILAMKKAQTNETIAALEAQLVTQQEIKKSQVETSKRNRNILQGIIRFVSAPLTLILKMIDGITYAASLLPGVGDIATNLEGKFSGGLANLIFDPSEVASEADATIKETKKQLDKLKNTRDGYELQERKNREKKKSGGKSDSDDEKKRQEELEALKDKIRDAEANKEDEARKLELQKIREHNEKLLKEAEAADLKTQELEDSLNETLAAKQAEFDKIDEERRLKKLKEDREKLIEQLELDKEFDDLSFEESRNLINEREAVLLADKTLSGEQRTELEKQFADARTEISEKEGEAKTDASMSYANSLGKISGLVGKETQAGKMAASAAALIQTYLAAQQARTSQLAIATPDAPVRAALAMAVEIAAGLKNVKEINSIKVPRASGGGTAPTPSASPTPPRFNVVGATETSQLADAVAGQTQQPIQAYVVSNDVTTAQSLQNNIVEGASIG
jgi:hypothetical protein